MAAPWIRRVKPKTKVAAAGHGDPVGDEGANRADESVACWREEHGPEQPSEGVESEDGERKRRSEGGEFGEEEGLGSHRQRPEDQHIAAIGEGRVPAEHGEEADDDHGGGD